jgi:hypothetical protein
MNRTPPESACSCTNYISDFELHLVTRTIQLDDGGLLIEPTWAKERGLAGPMLFISPIDAEIFRHCCHRKAGADNNDNWQRIRLSQFDLHQHLLDYTSSPLPCMLAFGFSATPEDELIAPLEIPRALYLPLPFAPPQNKRQAFNFNCGIFEYIRTQWNAIGAHQYAHQLNELNGLPDKQINALAHAAMQRASFVATTTDEGNWGIFLPDQMQWQFGPQACHQNRKALH